MCLLILRGPAGDVELKPPTPLEVVRAQEQGPRALRAQGWEDPIIVGSWEVPNTDTCRQIHKTEVYSL